MNTTEMQRLLSIAEVAERLGVSTKTVRRRISEGAIPAVKVGPAVNSPIRVSEAAVERWLTS